MRVDNGFNFDFCLGGFSSKRSKLCLLGLILNYLLLPIVGLFLLFVASALLVWAVSVVGYFGDFLPLF